jgi:hypothetical protein
VSVRFGVAAAFAAAACLSAPAPLCAQALTYRGFAELAGFVFPQDTPTDGRNLVVDFLFRGEAFVKPAPWVQFAAGLDVRANNHDQVEASWALDAADRGALRPALSLRRATMTLSRGGFTADIGKQFIRWGKADVVTPTDRFAPRDFVNVVDAEFLPVRGVRLVYERGTNTLDAVWVPLLTPSRIPILTQRWTTVPAGLVPIDATGGLPDRSQLGVRWSHLRPGIEFSASVFDGLNHLPILDFAPATLGTPGRLTFSRRYPHLRAYGVDAAVPTRWLTLKGEAAFFTSNSAAADDYALYVIQLERQTGEWLLVGGYAGEIVSDRRGAVTFAPDRGTARSIVGRASYTISSTRSAALEGAVRQNGRGAYLMGEVSEARGQHWRVTIAAAVIRGQPDDFLGQFRRNSHAIVSLRYSF